MFLDQYWHSLDRHGQAILKLVWNTIRGILLLTFPCNRSLRPNETAGACQCTRLGHTGADCCGSFFFN